MLKRFLRYYKPHIKLFVLDMVCAFWVAVCNMFYPFITKNIIGSYVPNKELDLMLVWIGVLLFIFLVKAVLNYIISYWGHISGLYIQKDMRNEMFRHLQKLPFSYYDEVKTGSVMSRLVNDLFDISELAHHGPEDVLLSAITILGALVMIYFIHPLLCLIIAIVIPIAVFVTFLLRKDLMAAFRKTRVETSNINSMVESSVGGIRVAKSYTSAEFENKKFAGYNDKLFNARKSVYKKMSLFNGIMGIFLDVLYLIALLSGGLFFYYEMINIADFTAFLLYINMLIAPIRTLVAIFEQIQSGMSGFVRFTEVMDEKPEYEPENPVKFDKLHGNIEYKNVKFAYNSIDGDDRKNVIDNLSLSIKSGQTVAFVGPSGGGKTTLCHLLPRFYDVSDGEITIDGINIRDISSYDLRRNIGIVAQDVYLYSGTIKENIAYGKLDATDDEIIEAAKKANIHDFVCTLPDGYDTEVGERGVKLSGGQKQRISIARAFLKNPPILILDEATSALDNMSEMLIQDSLEKLSEGRTTIVVAHRLSTVKNADEIIVITPNGISERGTHDELLKLNGEYAELYKYQFRGLAE